jgi:asparagine N-glycosylation enzyme membrane subunit Stt3
MKRTPLLLALILVVSLVVRIGRVGSFAVFPESDVYFYLNCYNAVLHDGAVTGAHPGFTSLLGSAGVLSDITMVPLYRYLGPLLGALTVLVVYACVARAVGGKAGALAAFLWGMTPLAVVRGGLTIAETLALPLLVLHVFLLHDTIRAPSRKTVLVAPILLPCSSSTI